MDEHGRLKFANFSSVRVRPLGQWYHLLVLFDASIRKTFANTWARRV